MLHHEEVGNPDGPPVVFVHGFLSSNVQWSPNVERLGSSLRMLLVELPGHGRSGGGCAGPKAAVEELAATIDAIGDAPLWFVGHSFGAALVFRYALAHPEQVEGIVFTNSRSMFGVEADGGEARLPRDLRQLPMHPAHAKRFPAELREQMVAGADRIDPGDLEALLGRVDDWRVGDEIHRLRMPITLVNGRWEKAFQPHVAIARTRLPQLKVVELEGGHSINVEDPDGFDRAVLAAVLGSDPQPGSWQKPAEPR